MIPPGTYWHPADLGRHITRWGVSGATEVRFSVVVLDGAPGVTLRPVFDVSLETMLSGAWAYFTASGISALDPGFYVTEWEPMNEDAMLIGEVYVGIVVEVSEEIGETDLVIGLAEVQIR